LPEILILPGLDRCFPPEKEIALILKAGSKIVYPSQGPCLIGPIVKRMIDERALMFYQLFVLNEGGGDVFIPVEKIESVGLRLLLNISEIPKLLDHLKQPATIADNYRQRSAHNQKLFASGSAFDLAEIVGSLTELNNTRSLSFGEQKTLEKAKGLLICEIVEVTGTTREAANEQLDTALLTRAKKTQTGSTARKGMAATRDQIMHQAASG
jgi:RNA polymerase-interacting CarD/CdnL/TRCF family regulator